MFHGTSENRLCLNKIFELILNGINYIETFLFIYFGNWNQTNEKSNEWCHFLFSILNCCTYMNWCNVTWPKFTIIRWKFLRLLLLLMMFTSSWEICKKKLNIIYKSERMPVPFHHRAHRLYLYVRCTRVCTTLFMVQFYYLLFFVVAAVAVYSFSYEWFYINKIT